LSALDWLRKPAVSKTNLSQAEQVMLGEMRANAYAAARSYLAAARERIFLNPLLKGSERLQNQEQIFSALLELPAETLTEQANKAITSDLRGWLSLAAMTRQHQNSPMQQLKALGQWRQVWSNHPAAENLPARLQTLSTVVENQAKSIALFLPLNGELAPFGRAIRDAIIASRFQLGRDVDLQVYDSSSADIFTLVEQAVAAGAELGIGPLDREQVTRLAQFTELPLPILALNRTLDGSSNPNLYQFGLAPEDEMIQVAEQVYREGKRNALIIYPDNAWGERNVAAFRNRWLALGGNIVNSSAFNEQKDYSTMVKTLLDVDLSEERANNLRRIIGQSFEFTPRRRQDIDFVFLLANQDEARGINPTLAFYYAEDIPVYSTSHVYAYSDSRIESIDLNGIRFCDIPWKLGRADTAQTELQNLWPSAKSALAPFYALGVDAFQLYPRLEQMKRLPDESLYGETGILKLDSRNVLNRTLAWAQFSGGEVIPAPQVIPTIAGQ
ncbi:MAG: penicillin-binding protein activator, partial [Pseudomonadales bacterium]